MQEFLSIGHAPYVHVVHFGAKYYCHHSSKHTSLNRPANEGLLAFRYTGVRIRRAVTCAADHGVIFNQVVFLLFVFARTFPVRMTAKQHVYAGRVHYLFLLIVSNGKLTFSFVEHKLFFLF